MKKLTLAIVAVVFAFGLSTVRAEETAAKKEEAAKPATPVTATATETAVPAGKAEEKKVEAKADAKEVKKEEKKTETKKEEIAK